MMWEAAAGTPHQLESKRSSTPTPIKNFLRTRIADRRRWANKYAPELVDELAFIHREVSNLNLPSLPVGDRRRWSVTDDVTGVTAQFEIERLQ